MRISIVKAFFTSIVLFNAVINEPGQLFAQSVNPQFEHLTVKNGLSSNRVHSIIQDRQGFYWIATDDGLNRFDGSSFKIFRYIRNDSTSLAHNTCTSLLEGDDGDIWVSTMKGVCRYQKRTGIFKNYFFHHPAVNDNIMNSVSGVTKDDKGIIWATSHGLWKINPVNDSITGFLYKQNDEKTIAEPTTVFNVSFDKMNKGLWMLTDYAINFFDLSTSTFFQHRYNPLQWPAFQLKDQKPLFAVAGDCVWLYDRKSEMLHRLEKASSILSSVHISFPHAISHFSVDGDGNPLFSFERIPAIIYNWKLQQQELLPQPLAGSGINFPAIVHRIFVDKEHNRWLCTIEGLFIIKHDANLLKRFSLGTDRSGFSNTIYSFVKRQDNLYLQLRDSLYKYDLQKQKLSSITGYKGGLREVLYNAGDTLLWLSGTNEIVQIDFKSGRTVAKISLKGTPYFTFHDKQQHAWVGTWDKGLYELDEKGKIVEHISVENGLPYNYLVSGCYDSAANELWVGMNGGKGFAKLDIQTRKIESFQITTGKKPTIEFNSINAIIKDGPANLWLGTHGGGIYYYDREKELFQNYQRSDGLSGDFINTLAFDKSGNLWISSTTGIDIMDVKTRTIRHVNEPMEQVNNDHIRNLAIGDDGTFYYSADNKILSVNPHQYTTTAPAAVILISGFKVSDKEAPSLISGSPINLSYRQNFFSLEFSVLKVSPDIPAQYKYKLQGFNSDWVYSNNLGFAHFTNVPPGRYTLLLNATNETGKWNDKPVELIIIIRPPFWKTWWFYLLSALLLGSLVLVIIKGRIRQFKKGQTERLRLIVATQEKEKKNISAELHDDLGVRLSALKYFVTSLRKYMPPGDTQAQGIFDKTITTIDESVEDVRYLLINLSPKTLNEYGYLVAVEDLVNKLSQLHIINITLQQKGMEQRLRQDVEAGLYRITQELINNTMKHANANSIHLNIERKNDAIQLHYADDGKGFSPDKNAGGYGIENIHTRVALLNGKIEWDAENGKPMKVIIVIPYNHTLV